jgi:hypothetical protein
MTMITRGASCGNKIRRAWSNSPWDATDLRPTCASIGPRGPRGPKAGSAVVSHSSAKGSRPEIRLKASIEKLRRQSPCYRAPQWAKTAALIPRNELPPLIRR